MQDHGMVTKHATLNMEDSNLILNWAITSVS